MCKLPHCETRLIIVTPPEVIADELETPRKRNEVEHVRGVREHSRVVSETGGRGTYRYNDGQFFPMAHAPTMFTMLKRATHDGSDWPTQPDEAYSQNQQVTRIDEDGSFFSTRYVETQLFKSKNFFGADAMDI